MAILWRRSGSLADRVAIVLLVPLAVLFVVAAFVLPAHVSTAVVDGESMLPSLRPGDRLIVRTDRPTIDRGDVLVFRGPDGGTVVKRVIGVPSDIVEMRDGRAFVNGAAETAASARLYARRDVSHGAYVVPPDRYYVAGDNRPVSLDSRYYGGVPADRIIGEAVFVYWPPRRLGPVPRFGDVDRTGTSD